MSQYAFLIVDDEPLARRRAARILADIAPAGIVHEAGNIGEARDILRDRHIDIVLLDVRMPGGDGFRLLEELQGRTPAVIFVTAFGQHALQAFDTAAVDYVTKPIDPPRLERAIQRAIDVIHPIVGQRGNGRPSLPRDRPSHRTTPADRTWASLTSQQENILTLVAKNNSNKEVARILGISHFTVRNHLTILYRAYGVRSRRSLIEHMAATGAWRIAD